MNLKFNEKQLEEIRRIIKGLRTTYDNSDGWECEFEGYEMYPTPNECAEPIEIANFLEFLSKDDKREEQRSEK